MNKVNNDHNSIILQADRAINQAKSISTKISRWSYPFLKSNEKTKIVTIATKIINELQALLKNLLASSNSIDVKDQFIYQTKIIDLAKSLKSMHEKVNSFTGVDSDIAQLNKKIKNLENKISSETSNIVNEISNLKSQIHSIEQNPALIAGDRIENLKILKDRLSLFEDLNMNLQSSKSHLINLNKLKRPIEQTQNIIKAAEQKIDLVKRIKDLYDWAENDHNNELRNLPGINLFFWTNDQAKKEAARLKIEFLSDQAKKVGSNLANYAKALNKLAAAYKEYIKLLPENTAEHTLASVELEKITSELNGTNKTSKKTEILKNIRIHENNMRSQLNKQSNEYLNSLQILWTAYQDLLEITQDPRAIEEIKQKINNLASEYTIITNRR